ncbi:hypothetical protein LPJ61_002066 [Coemansia biformis]|uniref:Uncharacterized protein n=1 Tax=Coemansia biformis TaxID=1286918 RepID=A0A9W7YE09_9FUNG|nr:hypothetical protein LPJ61_002066 [Coemansia biformis]
MPCTTGQSASREQPAAAAAPASPQTKVARANGIPVALASQPVGGVARLDADWSPFEIPAVVECLSRPIATPPSLLERREHTPLYSPSRHAGANALQQAQSPARVLSTFVGWSRPYEQISICIVDPESGEHLRRFPI